MIHHMAIAVKDFAASHHFYSEIMGFKLVAAVKKQADGGGWTKHVFYDMGHGKQFALWDLRGIEGVQLDADQLRAPISTGLGLPNWVNHVAFECDGEEDLQAKRQRWLDHGYSVSLVDHEFIRSIYTFDPDGNMVEWTYDTRPLNEDDLARAEEILADDSPATEPSYEVEFTRSTATKWRVKDKG